MISIYIINWLIINTILNKFFTKVNYLFKYKIFFLKIFYFGKIRYHHFKKTIARDGQTNFFECHIHHG